jgi:hypothetical protein
MLAAATNNRPKAASIIATISALTAGVWPPLPRQGLKIP